MLLCWNLHNLVLWWFQADPWWRKRILLLTRNPCNDSCIAFSICWLCQHRDNFSDFKSDSILLRFLPIHFVHEFVSGEISCPLLVSYDLFFSEVIVIILSSHCNIISYFNWFLIRACCCWLRSLIFSLGRLLLLSMVSKLSEALIISLSSMGFRSFFKFFQGILDSLTSIQFQKNKRICQKIIRILSIIQTLLLYFSSSLFAAFTGEFSFEANLKLLIKSGFLITKLSLLFFVAVKGILPFSSSTWF